MTLPAELATLDATAQADLVLRREVTPLELVDAAIARAERLNPTLNAIVAPRFDDARRAARGPLPDGPFRGVPFLLKDITAALAGVPLTSGSAFLRDYVPATDSELVARHKRAGLVVLGKTNTPEFGILPTTEPALFGATRNPWNLAHSTGGSSGGSAAAVAAGIVPFAHANDGGGSIRIPAACCGLFGLKPTRARNPLGPDLGDFMSGFVVEHAVTRSVRDSAALLDATCGDDLGPPYSAPVALRPYHAEVGTPPGRLRIGYMTAAATGAPVHGECVTAVERAMKLCTDLGHHVEPVTIPVDGAQMSEAFLTCYSQGTSVLYAGMGRITGRSPAREHVEPLTWALHEMGMDVKATDYLLAIAVLQMLGRQIAQFMVDWDVLVTPVLAEPPVPLGTFQGPPDEPLAPLLRAAMYAPFTPICNATGQPAMSVPLHWTPDGLPVGVHFIGRYGDEATLFRLAAQLEAAQPWAARRPPVFA